MKYFLPWVATLACVVSAAPVDAQVGVSIQIGQPSYYGRIDLGNNGTYDNYYPAPQVYYPQPIMIQRPIWGEAYPQPIYLRVPLVQAEQWRRYCGTYNACTRPVYFVRDDWYRNVYAPRYRQVKGWKYDNDDYRPGKAYGRHKGKGH
jgi:hypothetical protein